MQCLECSLQFLFVYALIILNIYKGEEKSVGKGSMGKLDDKCSLKKIVDTYNETRKKGIMKLIKDSE